MQLPVEIANAAQALGQSLRQDAYLNAFLKAVVDFQTDLEALQLEEQLYDTYNALITRHRSGEQLSLENTPPGAVQSCGCQTRQ
jgi:hypothetical protein